jgi:phosphate:Na+ symporter
MLNYFIITKTSFDTFLIIFGGLSVFLFGLNLTKENLKALASKKLEYYISNCTNTTLKSFVVGIVTTVLIQSSSGVTAIVVSFIAAGYLSFPQGLGIMIGANVGTCVTAFLFGINVEDGAFIIIIIASILSFVFQDKHKRMIFQAILGIGLIFLGLQFMGFGFDTISKSESFVNIMSKYANDNFPALIIGTILTFVIQSSSAIIGLLEQIFASNLISLKPSLALLLGSNIGTTLTGLIATIATTKEAKKAVIANIIFNILGVILFIFLLTPFSNCLTYLDSIGVITSPELMIAFAHLIFNVVTVILAYIFFNYLIIFTNYFFKSSILELKKSST